MCTKTAAQITLLQHKRPSSYRFVWSVKPCWHCIRVNLLENRSLYWDIHQSHHCGLPDAAAAHQDIRYWKLTGGFGDNKNVSHDVSNVSRSDTAVFHAWGSNCAQHQNAAVVFGLFEDRKLVTLESYNSQAICFAHLSKLSEWCWTWKIAQYRSNVSHRIMN